MKLHSLRTFDRFTFSFPSLAFQSWHSSPDFKDHQINHQTEKKKKKKPWKNQQYRKKNHFQPYPPMLRSTLSISFLLFPVKSSRLVSPSPASQYRCCPRKSMRRQESELDGDHSAPLQYFSSATPISSLPFCIQPPTEGKQNEPTSFFVFRF